MTYSKWETSISAKIKKNQDPRTVESKISITATNLLLPIEKLKL